MCAVRVGLISPLLSTGVTATVQWVVVLALYEHDGLTQAELCARVQIEQPTMANTLARMERDGLVERVPDPDDRRRSLVRLTPRARELQPDLVAAAQNVNATATRGIDSNDVSAFMATLATIIDNLSAAHPSAGRGLRPALIP